jgi:hypothetical protein
MNLPFVELMYPERMASGERIERVQHARRNRTDGKKGASTHGAMSNNDGTMSA